MSDILRGIPQAALDVVEKLIDGDEWEGENEYKVGEWRCHQFLFESHINSTPIPLQGGCAYSPEFGVVTSCPTNIGRLGDNTISDVLPVFRLTYNTYQVLECAHQFISHW